MKIKEVMKNVYHIDFSSREELLKTFIRFQEHYESPEFKDKIFTIDEYAEWYKKSRQADTFTYFEDWSGCNVPSYVFKKFEQGLFNPLREEEIALLSILPKNIDKYYVIGTFDGGDKDVMDHEILHGLFYSNSQYKERILSLLTPADQIGLLEGVKKYVLELGYHPSVVMDEVHAYIGASSESLDEATIIYPIEMIEQIRSISKEYL